MFKSMGEPQEASAFGLNEGVKWMGNMFSFASHGHMRMDPSIWAMLQDVIFPPIFSIVLNVQKEIAS